MNGLMSTIIRNNNSGGNNNSSSNRINSIIHTTSNNNNYSSNLFSNIIIRNLNDHRNNIENIIIDNSNSNSNSNNNSNDNYISSYENFFRSRSSNNNHYNYNRYSRADTNTVFNIDNISYSIFILQLNLSRAELDDDDSDIEEIAEPNSANMYASVFVINSHTIIHRHLHPITHDNILRTLNYINPFHSVITEDNILDYHNFLDELSYNLYVRDNDNVDDENNNIFDPNFDYFNHPRINEHDVISNMYKSFVKQKFTNIDKPINSQCPILLADFKSDDDVGYIIHCGHCMSWDSISSYLKTFNVCPLCRCSLINEIDYTGVEETKSPIDEN